MLIKILSAIDVIGGCILLFSGNFDFANLFIILGIIFLIKSSIGMWQDFGSWIDLTSGILFFILIFLNLEIAGIVLGILLIQKGIFGFV